MADGLEAAARAAAFAQLAVDTDSRPDEQGNGRGQPRDERDEADALARAFAELVGDEQACAHPDGHFRRGGEGGPREILR